MSCCTSKVDGEKVILGDTLMGCHEIALLKQAEIDGSRLKYAQFKQGYEESPYSITVDYEWKSVVLTIRGTLSLDDAVADLAIRPVLMDIWADRYGCECARGEFCHNGVLNIADYICQDLDRHGVLEKLFAGECSGYTLRIVGHSLGAGVAAVISTFLRPRYPSLRCLAFSPPGCVFSRRLAEFCKDYVTSYVLGDDVIPRLGLASMENLRHELLLCLSKIKVPKHKALRPRKRNESIAEQNSRVLYKSNADIPASEFWDTVAEFENIQTAKKTKSGPDIILYPPGKIIHLYRTSSRARLAIRRKPYNYVAMHAEVDDLQEIIISSTALADHQPYYVCQELEKFAQSFGLDEPYAPRT
jgi:sn1-specific diacylglycerol lipase